MSERYGYRALFASLALLLGLQLWAADVDDPPLAVALVGGGVLVAALWLLDRRPIVLATGFALMLPAAVGGVLFAGDGEAALGGSPWHAPFFGFVAVSVLLRVLRARRVDEGTVLGSACAYLLLAFAFASAYEAVEFFAPGSIAGLAPRESGTVFGQLTYFSLVTLTTLGYGELSPIHPVCQSLAIVESVVGTMFPAIVVARIVGVHAARSDGPLTLPEPAGSRESTVVRVLFFLLPITVLLLPALEDRAVGRLLVAGLLASLLIAGVYFVSGRRRVVVVGALLVVGALGLRLAGGDAAIAALVLEMALIGGVTIQMSRWCLAQRRATASMLLTAVCLYWLIGVGFAIAFQLVERIDPGAVDRELGVSTARALYFSFMTLTTTGYGDITPAAALPRAMAAIEAFLGIFYIAIVIAKLVSIYGSEATGGVDAPDAAG